MTNDEVKRLCSEKFRQSACVVVAKGNPRWHVAVCNLFACDPEHFFGTVKQHNFIAHLRKLHTRQASTAAYIQSASLRCVRGQEATQVLPGKLGTQPARRRLQVIRVFVCILEPRSIQHPHLRLHGTAENVVSDSDKFSGRLISALLVVKFQTRK